VRALAVLRGAATPDALVGRIVCHDVRDPSGKVAVAKGQPIDAGGAAKLLELPWDEVHVLELADDDLHEEPAGARVSAAAAGSGVEVKGYVGGQWTLAATRRGLCRVNAAALGDVNALPGMSVFTLWDLVPVEAGETVAKSKITPLAIATSLVAQAEERARAAGGLVSIQGFAPRVIGAVAREHLEPRQRQRFEASLTEKLDWFGSRLLPVRYPAADAKAVATDMSDLLDAGADLLIAAGAGSLDPLDPVFAGLAGLGGRMERHGAPAHPGSLLWLADLRGRPVIGMPACGMFSQATTFDLVLPRILSGDTVDNRALAELGHGGLLSRESAYRFPPYRKRAARGELGD
jgi:hypothetical protein